jgi:hypothetical protein
MASGSPVSRLLCGKRAHASVSLERKEYLREYYKHNRERILTQALHYRKENKQTCNKQYMKEYRARKHNQMRREEAKVKWTHKFGTEEGKEV